MMLMVDGHGDDDDENDESGDDDDGDDDGDADGDAAAASRICELVGECFAPIPALQGCHRFSQR